MGIGKKVGIAGSGAALNFDVVGNPKPDNPSENTIWLNTDAKITGWEISQIEPESITEGMVWIETGASSDIAFNALKKNSIMISPLAARQCISGELVEKPAQIYQNGEWKDWIDWSKWIVKDGLTNLGITGVGKGPDSSYSVMPSIDITKEDGYIQIVGKSGYGMVYFDPVDLTDVNALTIEGTFNFGSYEDSFSLAVWSDIGSYTSTNRVARADLTKTGATVDVSALTGKHYVGIVIRGASTQYITNFWRE